MAGERTKRRRGLRRRWLKGRRAPPQSPLFFSSLSRFFVRPRLSEGLEQAIFQRNEQDGTPVVRKISFSWTANSEIAYHYVTVTPTGFFLQMVSTCSRLYNNCDPIIDRMHDDVTRSKGSMGQGGKTKYDLPF